MPPAGLLNVPNCAPASHPQITCMPTPSHTALTCLSTRHGCSPVLPNSTMRRGEERGRCLPFPSLVTNLTCGQCCSGGYLPWSQGFLTTASRSLFPTHPSQVTLTPTGLTILFPTLPEDMSTLAFSPHAPNVSLS